MTKAKIASRQRGQKVRCMCTRPVIIKPSGKRVKGEKITCDACLKEAKNEANS